jgi:integrase
MGEGIRRRSEWRATLSDKWNYEFADIRVVEHQRTPMFTAEEITKIVAKAKEQARMVYILLAASGLRAGELFGLEVNHFDGNTLTVVQSVRENLAGC